MGFLGLGNFGTGFVTGFAQSVDKAVQDDIKRVNDRIDRISDIRVQRYLKKKDERDAEVEKYRKALEKGASVLGSTENAAFQMKKLGNDINLFNKFVNDFQQEKTKYGYEFDDFKKNMDNVPINPAEVTKAFTAKQYAGSIVPGVTDPSTYTVPESLTGSAGNLLSAILGKDRVNVGSKIDDQVSEELTIYGVQPTNSLIDFPTFRFDDLSYNLAKIDTVESRLTFLDQKLINPRVVGTEEERNSNPDGEFAKTFSRLTDLKNSELRTGAESVNIDTRLAVNKLRLKDINKDTDPEDYNTILNLIKEDELNLLEIKARNDVTNPHSMDEFKILKTQISLSEARNNIAQGINVDENKDEEERLQNELNDLNYELKIKQIGGETNATRLEKLKKEFELKYAKLDKLPPEGRVLAQNIKSLEERIAHYKQVFNRVPYTATEFDSAMVTYGRAMKQLSLGNLPEGVNTINSDGIPVFDQKLTAALKKEANEKLMKIKQVVFFGGPIGDTEYAGLIPVTDAKFNPGRYYALLDYAKTLGVTPPANFTIQAKGSTLTSSVSASAADLSSNDIDSTQTITGNGGGAISVNNDGVPVFDQSVGSNTTTSNLSNDTVSTSKNETETTKQTEDIFTGMRRYDAADFKPADAETEIKLIKARKNIPNSIEGIDAILAANSTANKKDILETYYLLYPNRVKDTVIKYINNLETPKVTEGITGGSVIPGFVPGVSMPDYLSEENLGNVLKSVIAGGKNLKDSAGVINLPPEIMNKLSKDEASNLLEIVGQVFEKQLTTTNSVQQIRNAVLKENLLLSEDENFPAQAGGMMVGSEMFTDKGEPKLKTKEKTYQNLSQEIANFNANKKFGGVNFPKDNKTIKIEQTIEEKIANMDSKELSTYTKGLVKKINTLLGNKSIKPKIVNNILTTSRLGDFGATFEPPLTPEEIEVLEKSNQILSSAEMAEMDANADKDIIYNKADNTTLNKAENAVNKRLKLTFNKTLDELITASKIVESKIKQGSDSMNAPEVTNFILETFLPASVKNSIKARADGSLLASTDELALAFKYVAAFSLSPTLEDLKNYQGDVRADVTTPLQKPPIPLSSPINQYSGGLMSRQ